MLRPLLSRLLFLTALLVGAGEADRTVSPTPLYAQPSLQGQPVLTLPAGKPVQILESSLQGERRVVAIPYGEQVLYARAGDVHSGATGVTLSGQPWGMPPQPAGPVTLYLERAAGTSARQVNRWVIRVLPLSTATTQGFSLKVQGQSKTFTVWAQQAREPVALGSLTPGQYLVTASRADAPASVLSASVLEVTDLALTALSTPRGLLVWATRMDNGKVLPGVRLQAEAFLTDQDGKKGPVRRLPDVMTDAQGLALLPRRDQERLRLLGSVRLNGVTHRTVFGMGSYGLGSSDPTHARTLIQTDKPVYRPGETLRGFAVVRQVQPGRRSPFRGAVTVRLVNGSSPPLTLAQQQVRTDADGLVRFTFPVPEDVRVGEYAVEVSVPGAVTAANPAPVPNVSRLPVRVQAFVKPQFTLDLAAPDELVAGDPLALRVWAELYAGGGADVKADVYLSGGYDQDTLSPPPAAQGDDSRYGYEEVAQDHWASAPFISPQQKPTRQLTVQGGQGTVTLHPDAPHALPRTYGVTVRARDEYGRTVLQERWLTVHPAGLKFALPAYSRNGYESRQPGEEVRSRVLVQQVGTGAPRVGHPVSVTVVRAYGEQVKVGKRTEYRVRQDVLLRQERRSDARGGVDVTFRVGKPGEYRVLLRAQDAQGRTVRGVVSAGQVNGPLPVPLARTLTLTPDWQRYLVGETARLSLKTDLPRGTPVLLSAEVKGRVTTRVVQVTGPQMTLSWPVTPDLSGGVRFGAVAVFGADTLQAGTPLLFVPRLDRQLDVQVSSPKAPLKPGASTTLTVRTRQGGKPVAALVTLAVVHEAVYAVTPDPTPDPWRLLWGAEYPDVYLFRTAGSYEGGGGGGSGDPPGSAFRQDGREVATFETVQTGADGTAQVQVRLPELLGPYRISARALSRDGSAGEAKRAELRAELPFAVRLSRPRVLTQGDKGSAYVSVQDRMGGKTPVTLGFKAAGPTTTRVVPLNLGSGMARFSLTAPASGTSLTLDAWAQRGTQRDALRETLPLRAAGPRTLLTARGTQRQPGVLTDPLTWPQGSQPESLVVDLAATPLQAALGSLDAYLQDPAERWATTEGTAARLSTNLDLAGLAARLGWTVLGDRARVGARQDLASLLALHVDGGWGWTAASKPTAEMTGRALQALVQAKGAGLTDAGTVDRSVREARALLTTSPDSGQVLLAVALVRAGDPAPALKLARSGSVKAPADQARLAAVLAGTDEGLARTLYVRARRQAEETRSGSLVLENTEATALLLHAALLLKVQPDVTALRAGVLAEKTGSAWESPVATSAAVAALRVLAETEARTPAPRVRVTVGDFEKLVTVGAPLRLLVSPSPLEPGQKLTLEGNGPFAFVRELRVRVAGAPPAVPSTAVIERRYDRSKAGRDEVVTVTLTVRAPTAQRHLRITDPLPGGLEAVDDRPFAFPGWVQPAGAVRALWAERSLYDDRAVFYLESVPAGVTTLRYPLRALAPGIYTAPAPRVDFSQGGASAVGSAQAFEVTQDR